MRKAGRKIPKDKPNFPNKYLTPANKKKSVMIVSICMLIVSLIFSAITLYFLLKLVNNEDKAISAIGFIIFLFTYGWMTYIPAVATSIAGIVTGSHDTHSSSKTIKAISVIFLILNILLFIALVLLVFLVLVFPARSEEHTSELQSPS